jgi:deoxyribodipyrimidine photo-lyase
MTSSIIWFRQDLRLADQAAVAAAAASGPVLPVYVLDDETPGEWRIGAAQRWWLHHSLAALDASLRRRGARLILLRGRAADRLAELAAQAGGASVHALAHYEPWAKRQEAEVASRLDLRLHDGATLIPPDRVRSATGGRYRIFTPFWRALRRHMPPPAPVPAPDRLVMADAAPDGERLDDWSLLPARPNWAVEFDAHWTPGEAGAEAALDRFLGVASAYDADRNKPAEPGSSRLSPHLHHGELSPACVWHALEAAAGASAEPFLREIGWRDFATGLVDQFPDYHLKPSRAAFARFAHRGLDDPGAAADFRAWQEGRTGYPIVDAGMRQLWRTGWMHNRVRMIAASFLVKHLLIDWREGLRWFWDTLVDADLGNNSLGWQWIMGSGVDSSPFGRIFAPVGQGEKFDPRGDYVRRWVPELAALPADIVHQPWSGDPDVLARAGVVLGRDYPLPIVGHAEARQRALDAYRDAKVGDAPERSDDSAAY